MSQSIEEMEQEVGTINSCEFIKGFSIPREELDEYCGSTKGREYDDLQMEDNNENNI